jgi:transcriptional regulator GlxA family with amidase domain
MSKIGGITLSEMSGKSISCKSGQRIKRMLTVGFILFPGYQVMSLAVLSVFEYANIHAGKAIYDVKVLSEGGGPIRTSVGLSVDTVAFDDGMELDTLIVGGGTGVMEQTPGLIAFIRNRMGRSRRIAAGCTGAFILAEAGLLDGRRVTTHWQQARTLQMMYPKVKLDEDRIFIADGPIWTSAGMTAVIDLALAMVEADLGADIARSVARKLVLYHRRAGGQSQFSELLELEPKSDRIQRAIIYARANLQERLDVNQLAEVANLSPRQFSRAFHAETGQSPAKAVERIRLESARVMMEQGRLPIEVVARQTGFADRDRMRRAFLRTFGQPPQVLRRAARVEGPVAELA